MSVPVYSPEDYGKVIARVQKKVADKNITLGRCLSETAIAEFERSCNIRLPQAFRMFLKEVGDGCESMIDGFRLNRLEEIERKDLSRPFPLEKAWIWEDEAPGDGEARGRLKEKIEERVLQGNLQLIDIGCCMTYQLIVTGPCRGEVWNFCDVGVQPCWERQDFLGWFELWLDDQEAVDYFKDYPYP